MTIKHFHLMEHPYVFIVLYYEKKKSTILGVYTNRETAEAKVNKHIYKRSHKVGDVPRNDYAILKKTIEGRRF